MAQAWTVRSTSELEQNRHKKLRDHSRDKDLTEVSQVQLPEEC